MFLCHIYKYCNPPFVVSCFYSTQKACPNCRNYTKCSRGSISDVGPEVVYILYYFCGITQTSGKVLQYCFKISYGIAARSRAVASHFVAFRNNYVLRCGAISRKIKPLQSWRADGLLLHLDSPPNLSGKRGPTCSKLRPV